MRKSVKTLIALLVASAIGSSILAFVRNRKVALIEN